MMNRFVHWLVINLVVAWLFLITLNYYIVHKPFSAENALAILNALGDALIAGALIALSAALGYRVLRAFQFDSPLDALIFQSGLGLGLLALATFALGLVIVHRFVFWALFVLAAFLLRNDLRAVWHEARAIQLRIPARFERVLALFVAFTLGIAGLVALLPPTAWDAQTYHLVIPKVALEQGHIIAPPDIVYFNFPSLGEMLFLAAMLLKSDVAAQVLHFGFLVLTLGVTFAFALRYFNARVAWLADAILVVVPSLVIVATWPYVDLMLTFYTFASFYALMRALEQNQARWFALAGAFAGLAMGIKYTAVIVPVALLVVWIARNLVESKSLLPPASRRLLPAYCLLLTAFALPWYLRNLIFTGNPFYPFVFGGKYWDAFRAEWFSRFGTGLVNDPIQLVLAPWYATIYGVEGALGFEATIGPLLLMLIPLLVLGVQRSKFEGQGSRTAHHAVPSLLLFSLILYLFWLFGVAQSKLLAQTRLLFPAFPAFALLAAIAFDRLSVFDLPQFSLQRFARLVVLLVSGLTVFSYALGLVSGGTLAYLVGVESREVYLARNLDGYGAAVRFINTQLPRDARVLFLWEPRVYYAERAAQPDSILDAWAHLRWQYRDADTIAAELRARGYTHVLLSRAGLDFILQTGYDPVSLDDMRVLEEFATRHLRLVFGKTSLQIVTREGKPAVLNAADDSYAVYEIVRQVQ